MIIEFKRYGNSLVSRDLAKKIVASFDISDEQIDLDFEGVETITPSFSHEMLSAILEFKEKPKKVNFLHTNSSVELQLKKALITIREEKK